MARMLSRHAAVRQPAARRNFARSAISLSESCARPVDRAHGSYASASGGGQRVVAEPRRLPLGVLAGHQFARGAAASASVISPRRWAASSGTPCARIAGSAGSRRERQQGRAPPSTAPCAIMAAKRRAIASRSAARGGSSRIAANRHGAGVPRSRLPCREAAPGAAPHLPGARDALAVARAQPRGRRRIDRRQRRVQRGRPVLRQQPPRLRPRRLAGVGDVGDALGQRGEIEAGAAAQDRQPGRRPRRIHSRSAAPRHQAALPGSAAGRTP